MAAVEMKSNQYNKIQQQWIQVYILFQRNDSCKGPKDSTGTHYNWFLKHPHHYNFSIILLQQIWSFIYFCHISTIISNTHIHTYTHTNNNSKIELEHNKPEKLKWSVSVLALMPFWWFLGTDWCCKATSAQSCPFQHRRTSQCIWKHHKHTSFNIFKDS